MSGNFTESVVEKAALEWFGAIGYGVVFGPTIAPDEAAAERASYEQVLLEGRLRAAFVDGAGLTRLYRDAVSA